MKSTVGVWLVVLLGVAPAYAVDAAPPSSLPGDQGTRVESLLAPWNSDASPGGVVAVIREGAIVYRRAFGMANLDFGVPNTPQTLFPIASVSKQFTAFAILLLEQDGKLSLDDDVRKYVPEVSDFGKTITLRHLLHHTSGLRDQAHLMWIAGWRWEDELTREDVLRMVERQQELNFPPGEQMLYSNTGYTLLGLVVERVSGQSLAAFTAARIFGPLGMTHSQVQDDHHRVIRDRAVSYRPARPAGFEALSMSDSTTGETGVVTNIEDLSRWDQNFYDAKVGGRALIARMQAPGTLNNGQRTGYAAGLDVDAYRGLKEIGHSGSIAGYRCHSLRIPDCRVSVLVLSNAENLPATDVAHQIADIVLADRLQPVPATKASPQPSTRPAASLALPPALLDAYVGDYQIAPGNYVTITREQSQLRVQGTGSGRVPMFARSPTTFGLPNPAASVVFVKGADANHATGIRLLNHGKEQQAHWIPTAPPADYVGDFYSPELRVIYGVTLRDGKLCLDHPRGRFPMDRAARDQFDVPFPMRSLTFQRDDRGRCTGFVIEGERARHIRFRKVDLGS